MRKLPWNWALSALWIIIVSVFSILFAVYSLTAFQIQSRIHSFSAEGHSYSVWNLERLRARQQLRQVELTPLEAQLKEIQLRLLEGREDLFKAQGKSWSLEAQMNNFQYQIHAIINQKDPAFNFPKEEFTYQTVAALMSKLDQLGLRSLAEDHIGAHTRVEAEWYKLDAALYRAPRRIAPSDVVCLAGPVFEVHADAA